jgi:hypothetical protein
MSKVYDEIAAEREKQETRHAHAEPERRTHDEWSRIVMHVARSTRVALNRSVERGGDIEFYRQRLLMLGAAVVSAIDAIDRDAARKLSSR